MPTAAPMVDSSHPVRGFSGLRTGRAGAVEFAGTLILKFGAVIQTVIVARLYGVTDVGAWATALLVVGSVTAMASLKLEWYVLSTGDDNALRSRLDAAFTLSLAVGLVGMAVLYVLAPLLTPLLSGSGMSRNIRALSPLILGAALFIPSVLWERQLQYAWPKLPPFIGTITFVAVAATAKMWLDWNVQGLIAAQLGSLVATSCTIWLLAPLRPRLTLNTNLFRPQLAFSLPLLASGLAGFVAGQGDDLLVRVFYGGDALAIYVIAFYLPSYVLALAETAARVAVPALAPLRETPSALNGAFTLFARYIAAASVGAGVIMGLFAREIVLVLFGIEWIEAVPLVRVFSVAFILRASTGLHWQSLAYLSGRTRYLMWSSLASAAFMLAVAPPLIWKFGLMGGAIYSFVQLAIMGPLVRFPLIRETVGDLTFLRSAIAPLVAGSAAVLGTTAVWWIAQPSYHLLISAPVCCGVYLAVLYRLDPLLLTDMRRLVTTRHAV